MGNVAQPPLGKASGERGCQAGPMSMGRFSCVGQPSDAGFTGRKETSSQGSSQESLTAEGDLCFLGRMGGDHSIWYTDMEAGMLDS